MNKIYVHVSLNFDGGVGTVVKNLVANQIKNNDEVILVGRPEQSIILNSLRERFYCEIRFFKPKVSVLPQIIKGKNLKKIYLDILRERNNKNIIFIVHNVGTIGLFGKCIKNTFVIIHGHENKLGIIPCIFYQLLFAKLKKKCIFISCSKECGNYYAYKYRLQSHVIQNGLNVLGHKKDLYTYKRTLNVCMLSTLNEYKGFQFFLEAATICSKKTNDIMFYAIGKNDMSFDIESKSSYLGLDNNFRYLGEDYDAADKYLPNMDLLILPSQMEGLPMSLIEAQAYGIPILATEVGGIPEILKDGYNGYFIKRNGDDIADKITKCSDIGNYIKLSQNSKNLYMQNFTAEKMFSNYENFINETLGSI